MQVPYDKLCKGLTVWYRYSRYRELSGPYMIEKLFSDHEGKKVELQPRNTGGSRVILLLADDDDFGMLLFYDSE